MPTNKQRVALSKQTTNRREDRNVLSFFVSGQTWNQELGWESEQTSKQAREAGDLNQNKQASKHKSHYF